MQARKRMLIAPSEQSPGLHLTRAPAYALTCAAEVAGQASGLALCQPHRLPVFPRASCGALLGAAKSISAEGVLQVPRVQRLEFTLATLTRRCPCEGSSLASLISWRIPLFDSSLSCHGQLTVARLETLTPAAGP